jgi:hypothetical protein
MPKIQVNAVADPLAKFKLPLKTDFNWRRVNRRNPCPICSHTDWCEVSDDGLTVHCLRQPGDKEVNWRGGGWLHFLGVRFQVSGFSNQKTEERVALSTQQALASVEERAAAIEWLIEQLELSEQHREYLASEDMTETGWKLGYRTLPGAWASRRELLDGLENRFGREMVRGLGFVYERIAKAGGRYLEFAGVLREVEALIIPVRDLAGRPITLKARSVHPESGERLYRAMSAGNTALGASVGTPIHVARPEAVLPDLEGWAIITEGEKKADYAAMRLGVVTLGVQGVSNWRAGKLLPLLRELGVHTVVEAFDADRVETTRGKDNIERQARLLSEQCAAADLQVFGARWQLTQGKGLDDFLRNQPDQSAVQWPDLHRFKPASRSQNTAVNEQDDFQRRYGLSRERAGRIAGQFISLDPDTVTNTQHSALSTQHSALNNLQAAREELAQLFGSAFARHIASQGKEPSRVLLRTTTGTGKTTAAQNEIIRHLALGRPGRILYLTDTKQAYAGLFEPGGPLTAELQVGNIAIREGRTDKPGAYHCERQQECQELGANRQPASADICGSCPFGSPANYRRYATEYNLDPESLRHFECEKAGYLASVKRCKEAQVVIGPKAALLTASDELSEFDFIIIDEDCTAFLLERQTLARPQLAQWEEGRRRLEFEAMVNTENQNQTSNKNQNVGDDDEPQKDPAQLAAEHAPFDQLLNLVAAALSDFEAASQNLQPSAFSLQPSRSRFMTVLKARAAAVGADLAALVNECMALLPSRRFRRYQWEKPFKQAGRVVAPLRFARDLIEQLAAELDNPEGSDTRLWIERDSQGATLQVYLPRHNLLNILTGQTTTHQNHFKQPPTVFYLDATAGPVFRLAVPGVEEVEIKIPQPLYIIQTTNALYTARSLAQGNGLPKIGQAIESLAKRFECKDVAVFSRKSFNPDYAKAGEAALTINLPGVRFGHFERHNKGSNDYAGIEMLAIVGHYSQPLDELQALVEAFRNRHEAPPPQQLSSTWSLRAYQWHGSDGKGLARWCKAHPDPDIQAAIEHSARANILQTIGRGRAALRPSDKPLVVALFTSWPVAGLKIDELTEVSDILEVERITERQRAALEAGRKQANTARHAAAVERIATVKETLVANGEKFIAPGRLAQLAGVARSTLRRLGYGWQGRWIRLTEIREVLPLDIFISFKTSPAYRPPEYQPLN